MPVVFVPKSYSRDRSLTEAQQHVYDVIRTLGHVLYGRNGWQMPNGEQLYGMNSVALRSLCKRGLVIQSAHDERSDRYAPRT